MRKILSFFITLTVFTYTGTGAIAAEGSLNPRLAEQRQAFETAIEERRLYDALNAAEAALTLGRNLNVDSETLSELIVDYLSVEKNYLKARTVLTEIRDRLESTEGKNHSSLMNIHSLLGDINLELYDTRSAEDSYRKLISVAENNDLDTSLLYRFNYSAGEKLAGAGDFQAARKFYNDSIRELDRLDSTEETAEQTALVHYQLATMDMAINYYPGAERAAKRGLKVLEKTGSQSVIHFELNLLLARLKHFEANTDGSMDYLLTLMNHPLNVIDGSLENYSPIVTDTPEYPPEKNANGEEGWVLLEYTVDEQGFVQNPKVADSEGGKAFEEEVLSKIVNFRYIPRAENGEPVKTEGVQQFFAFQRLTPRPEELGYQPSEMPDDKFLPRTRDTFMDLDFSRPQPVTTRSTRATTVGNANTSSSSSVRSISPVE